MRIFHPASTWKNPFRRVSFQEKAFAIPRRWSNRELIKFGPLFSGSVVNVSAWEDKDKEGRCYEDYFSNSSKYTITNFGTSQGHLQNRKNEHFLDLEMPLAPELVNGFDVVFNHTTLEHVWDFQAAFSNLCKLSKDVVVIVVPWLQPLHSDYGDYWRFSPQALARLFDDNGLQVMHLSWNDDESASVYCFGIGSRFPERWDAIAQHPSCRPRAPDMRILPETFAGKRAFG